MKKHLFLLVLISFLFVSCTKKNDENVKAIWIHDAFTAIKSNEYAQIKAISWWHENWEGASMRIDSSLEALKAYQEEVADPIFVTNGIFESNKLIPTSGIYLSAFPDFGAEEETVTADRIDDFEALSQHDIFWAYFSNNWMNHIAFPMDNVEIIHNKGKVPFIRMMARSIFEEDTADSIYSMQKILDGDFDTELNQWAIDAASLSYPILVEFGTEVNGSWFPWNGLYNGADTTDAYGDSNFPDGPERFRDAYRHIIEICRNNNANNITWFFHIDTDDEPEEEWNNFENYYPGDDYIDWIGISVYGSQSKTERVISFKDKLDKVYQRMLQITQKPLAILEFGVAEQ